jgi:antitoxin YefM
MDAVTTRQASQNLDDLIEKVIANIEPTIVCNDQGRKAVFTPFSLINRPLCKMPQALISLGFALIL